MIIEKIAMDNLMLPLIFVMDTSCSADEIDAFNRGMSEVIKRLKSIFGVASVQGLHLKLNVLIAGTNVEWMYPEHLININEFNYIPLKISEVSNFGESFSELDIRLSRRINGFLRTELKILKPNIVFISNSKFMDKWDDAIKSLSLNKWYCVSNKLGFVSGKDNSSKIINRLVDKEKTFEINELSNLPDYLQIEGYKYIGITNPTPRPRIELLPTEQYLILEEFDCDDEWYQ